MVDVRVDAAVRDESEQMNVPATLACAAERADERLVLEERPIRYRAVHALEVLVENAPAADRQVADLRVPHLSRRQADRLSRGVERRVRVLAPEPVEHRRVRELDGVAGPRRCAAPTVEDDEHYEWIAAWQIAANDSTSRDAPPTRAPSTLGCPRSSAALSGFTEPP